MATTVEVVVRNIDADEDLKDLVFVQDKKYTIDLVDMQNMLGIDS